ncbi:MAG: penicillin-binding protein 1B [Desulfobacter sp.]|nr:MAG: penicillin-binding protein 1B [Desulfobacter sp.]
MKRLLRFILVLGVAAAGAAGFIYYNHFDTLVQTRFQGRLWELPARVYARPMEVYEGMHLDSGRFEKELALMGYRRAAGEKPEAPGTYQRTGSLFRLYLRAFDFGDEKCDPRRIRFRIKEGVVDGLQRPGKLSAADSHADLARLDPVVIGSFYPDSKEDRILVDLDAFPPLLAKAIVAVEDRNFYTHHGIDPKSVLRAVAVNLKKGRLTQGASTLTQQLARNFFLTREKTLTRKVNEAVTALALERRFSKEDILEAYMNEVYLGQDGRLAIHGFGLASQFYFGKSPQSLQPREIALLVGLLKGPSAYHPRRHPKAARARRDVVLHVMAGQGLISDKILKKALAAPLGVVEKEARGHSPFPYYLDLVKRRLMTEYHEADLKTMGLRIFTALDPQVQLAAEAGTAGFLKGRNRHLDAGVVVTSLATNEIQALVGGKDFRYKGFNRALDARRPIGSLVKPAIYLTALLQPEAYTMLTPLDDGAVAVENPDGSIWRPQNFDRQFHGQVRLYRALVNSYNTSAVRLGMALGLDRIGATLEKMGYTPRGTLLPSMLLGSLEMSPMQVAQLYHCLAAGGFYIPAKSIRAVYTPRGQALSRYPLSIDQRLDPGAVFLVSKILQAVVDQGSGRSLEKWMPKSMGTAGKTGTTNDLRDSWFAGFTGSRLAVAWTGRDDNKPAGLTGASGALQIFGRVMSRVSNTPLVLSAPENIEWAAVDMVSGMVTDPDCPGAVAVPFIKGSGPVQYRPCSYRRTAGGQRRSPSRPVPEKVKPKYLIDWLKEIF